MFEQCSYICIVESKFSKNNLKSKPMETISRTITSDNTHIKQEIGDIKFNTLTVPNTDVNYITIHQDGKTIFLEHANIIKFLKTVSNFK